MLDHISENLHHIFNGLLFGFGILAVYLGAIFTGALIRSLGGAGSQGLSFVGRYVTGWVDYLRGDERNTVNVTLNMITDDHLAFDTLVADRRIWEVWPNAFRVHMIRLAARRTTKDNPVLVFPDRNSQPRSWTVCVRDLVGERVRRAVASVKVVENGRAQRVPHIREDDYKATYGPLISLVGEKCTNDVAIDRALGRPMDEFRFVVALTFEQLNSRRARHLRAMVMWEETLLNLPEEMPRVDFEEHKTRYRTLQAIAREYRRHPERFGVVKVWRRKGLIKEHSGPLPVQLDAAE